MKINHQNLSSFLQRVDVKRIILVSFLFYIFFVYAWNLDRLPPNVHGDEGETAIQALEILSNNTGIIGVGWYDLPLLSFIPHSIGMILGPAIVGDRMGSVVFGIGTIIVFYLLINELFKKQIAIISTMFLATSHMWIALSRLGITYTQATFCLVLTLYFVTKGMEKHSAKYFIFAGASAGISIYSYYGVRIIPVLLSIILLFYLSQKSHFKQRIKNIVFLSITGLIVFLPQGIFYLNNPLTFSSRTDSVFVLSETGKSWSNYNDKNSIEILFVQTKKTLNIFVGDNSTQYGYKGHLLDIFSLIFIICGIIYSLIHIKNFKYLFILVWFFLAVIGQILTTIPTPIFLPRFVVGVPILFLFGAIGTVFIWEKLSFNTNLKSALFIGAFIFIFLYNFKTYFIDYPIQVAKGVAGGGVHELTPRKISDFINSFPQNHSFFFMTKPFLSSDYGTIRFLARGSSRFEIDPKDLPAIKGDSSFILYPEYEGKIKDIQRKFPNGVLKRHYNYFNEIEFITYTVHSK